jgi:hypothetical protein
MALSVLGSLGRLCSHEGPPISQVAMGPWASAAIEIGASVLRCC